MTEYHLGRSRRALARRQLYAACLLALASVGGTGAVHAQSSEAPRAYAIEAGTLETALNQLSRQSQVQIVFPPELVAGKRAGALSGQLTWREALSRLLQGSGLGYRQVADETIVIQKLEVRPAPAKQSNVTSEPATPPDARTEPQATDLERMTVTGTRIRGGATPSPVISIGAEQIQQEGFNDLGEVIRAVPQNFNGGQNPGMAGGSSNVANQNLTGGSALNLRGLGPDATLTLLNGRRLTYTGFTQAVDIGAIPVEAVERLEIIPDGASAIYGSDAVGGVANVILKRDVEGVSVSARYGVAEEGGLGTREYTATMGTRWSTGGLIATYKDSSSDPIYADQRDYTDWMIDPYTIYFGNEMRSGLVSIHQAVGDTVELTLDALKTHREVTREHRGEGFHEYYAPETSIWLVSPGAEFFLPGDWSLTLGGTYGKDKNLYKVWLGDGITSELDYLGMSCSCNESRTYEMGAEGPVFAIGGGDARLAVGLGARKDSYLSRSYPSLLENGGDERARFAYAELNLPFVSSASSIAGVQRLELTGAIRSEDYESFGRVNTPKLGLIYGPSPSFTLKASWGKSFKAPALSQRYERKTGYLFTAAAMSGTQYPSDATALLSNGGSADLQPERARTWTASLAFHPTWLPEFQAELTVFDIDFTDRVVVPINYLQALSNPIYAEFVHYAPTAEEQAAFLAEYGDSFYNLAGADYDPARVVAVVRGDNVNAARQRAEGADLSGSYQRPVGAGQITIRGSASWLKSSQQTSAGQPEFDLAGTSFNAAKVNSRLGAVWSQGPFSVSSFMNYTSGVTKREATFEEKTASFTTVDTTLRYDASARAGALSGFAFALSVMNLLNRDPPLYTPASIYHPPYDSSNYSAIGRFWSVSVSKQW